MILVGFFCVLGAIGLLVAGLAQADPDLVWASITASAVGGLAVAVAAVQRSRVLRRAAVALDSPGRAPVATKATRTATQPRPPGSSVVDVPRIPVPAADAPEVDAGEFRASRPTADSDAPEAADAEVAGAEVSDAEVAGAEVSDADVRDAEVSAAAVSGAGLSSAAISNDGG
ncbi:MAG: hypothetical protein ACR2J5_18125, partial [Geodermatophilaceae bacterium]